jgi:hypothetical protein
MDNQLETAVLLGAREETRERVERLLAMAHTSSGSTAFAQRSAFASED